MRTPCLWQGWMAGLLFLGWMNLGVAKTPTKGTQHAQLFIHNNSSVDCDVFVNKKRVAHLKPSEETTLSVLPGEHLVVAEPPDSSNYGRFSQLVSVPVGNQKVVQIQFAIVKPEDKSLDAAYRAGVTCRISQKIQNQAGKTEIGPYAIYRSLRYWIKNGWEIVYTTQPPSVVGE